MGDNLLSGASSSCGRHGHGLSDHPLYSRWSAMLRRCSSPSDAGWKNYGGRGIRVCERWSDPANGFRAFLDDMGQCPDGMSLDRVDVDGDYEPSNCRWADKKTQRTNQRGHKAIREASGLRMRVAALESEIAALRASVTRVERRQRGEDPRQLRLAEGS